MRIVINFRFDHDSQSTAVTGVEGDVTDIILPGVGDTITHRDEAGNPFQGRVAERIFDYDMADGTNVEGTVTVTLSLARVTVQ